MNSANRNGIHSTTQPFLSVKILLKVKNAARDVRTTYERY